MLPTFFSGFLKHSSFNITIIVKYYLFSFLISKYFATIHNV